MCGADGAVLCEGCIDEFRRVEDHEACPVCGRWLGTAVLCGECSGARRPFVKGSYGFYYEGRLRDAIHAFKFNGQKEVGRRLVRIVEDKVRALSGEFDRIVPVPVSGRRLRERGFNQSFIIAAQIAGITGKDLCHGALVKRGMTKDQYTLPRIERRKNIKGAFFVQDRASVMDKRILLVDDLFTTGYTAGEAARTLKAAGSGDVALFALARTP